MRLRGLTDRLYLDDKIKDYIIDLVFATRDPAAYDIDVQHFIQYGASPRATLSLTVAAKAHALLQGRGYVHASRCEIHRPGYSAPPGHYYV